MFVHIFLGDVTDTKLRLASILDGMIEFAKVYNGQLVTETVLVKNLNDNDEHVREVTSFLARLKPAKAYLAIPTRPSAENGWNLPMKTLSIEHTGF